MRGPPSRACEISDGQPRFRNQLGDTNGSVRFPFLLSTSRARNYLILQALGCNSPTDGFETLEAQSIAEKGSRFPQDIQFKDFFHFFSCISKSAGLKSQSKDSG